MMEVFAKTDNDFYISQAFGPANLLKIDPAQFRCEICEMFKNTYFEERL